MHRHEVDDRQWEAIKGLFPRQRTGRPRRDDREMLDAVLWILHSGAAWRDLPERYGPWQSAYWRFSQWREHGTLRGLREKLVVDLNRVGAIDWKLWCVDGSNVRAGKSASGGGKKGVQRSRGTTP